jgi:hypothetical protein
MLVAVCSISVAALDERTMSAADWVPKPMMPLSFLMVFSLSLMKRAK